jgi:hypothetical protein
MTIEARESATNANFQPLKRSLTLTAIAIERINSAVLDKMERGSFTYLQIVQSSQFEKLAA